MKRLLSLVFMASLSAALMAEEISVDRALSMARQYINVSAASVAKSKGWAKSAASSAYYVFEGEGGKGWAVVSTDDAMGGVLAYSETSAFDTTVNTAAAMMLRAYSKAYEQYQQTGEAPQQARSRTFAKRVGPLMTTHWSQNYPYNRRLPNGYSYTGCGPTAMAQVMRFHEWPEKGHGTISYTNYYDMKTITDTLGHTYNWKIMLDSDFGDYLQKLNLTQAQKDSAQLEVAQLMFDCGAFSRCSYEGRSLSASWETELDLALKTYFDYEASMFYQAQEGRQAFYDIVSSEIVSGFPVILSGDSKSGGMGHVFVGDGVDTDGRIHINYGWGYNDGFYVLETINFSSNMKAVLAHPLGKAGSAPMPKDLRDDATHLHFSTDGYIHMDGLKADSAIARPKSITLLLANFTNLGKPFRGDLGVALVGENGDTVYVGGSESYAQGGFTTKLSNGIFGSSNKIVEDNDVRVSVPLTKINNGFYKVVPLAAAYNDSTSRYSEWGGLHVYPQFELELTANTVRISEEGGPIPGSYAQRLQIAGLPVWSKDSVKAGDNVSLSLPIDNIKGIAADGTLTVALFSNTTGDSLTAATTKVNIAGFYQDTITTTLSIPANAADDAYRLRLTLNNGFRTDTVYAYHLNRPTYLLVGNATMPTPQPDPEPTPVPDPEPVVITLPQSGFLAYCADKDMRFEAWQNEGVTAYAVAVDADSLILVAVDEARKGEGVILKGAPLTEVEVPAEAAALATSAGSNLLMGVLDDAVIPATTETTVNFRFLATGTLVSFQPIAAEGETIATGSAYLALPTATAEAVGAQDGLTLHLSDNGNGSLTSIASATNAPVATSRDIIYDLRGQRVANPQRGIYIVNGRKVIY